MTIVRPQVSRPGASSLATAMRELAFDAWARADAATSPAMASAFDHLAEMLVAAGSGTTSPLLEELKTRILAKGGDAADRVRNQMAGALVILLMRGSLSQREACRLAAAHSGLSATTLKRIVQGVTIESVESLLDWPIFAAVIDRLELDHPQGESEDENDWHNRLIMELMAKIGNLKGLKNEERRRHLRQLFAERTT